jgi:hypothetical protein
MVGFQWGAIDGSKIHTDASKHQAVSYQRMTEVIPQLEEELARRVGGALTDPSYCATGRYRRFRASM